MALVLSAVMSSEGRGAQWRWSVEKVAPNIANTDVQF